MGVYLADVTPSNFDQVIDLKSDAVQEQRIQIYERWVGSNAYFLGLCHVYSFLPRAIYHDDTLIGFACHGFDPDTERYELVSLMLGHQYQGQGFGSPSIKLVIDEMINLYQCEEIYLSVIHDNIAAIRLYEKAGFEPTGEVEQAFHAEPIYKLKVG